MPPAKKQKQSNVDSLVSRGKTLVSVDARSDSQQMVVDLWPRTRVMFLVGPAGVGKTHIALALALAELLRRPAADKPKLMLSRPMVAVDELIGFLPGSVEEKIGPWLGPFKDVLGQITFDKWESLLSDLDVETVPVGMLRGRTVRNGVLIVDEAQAMTPAQIKCVLTRIGEGGRIILCGDPGQSDKYTVKNSPLLDAARRLDSLDLVTTVNFNKADQLRDGLITDILDRL